MTINILVVSGGATEGDIWTDADDNIRLVVVNWDDVSRDMFDGRVDRLSTLYESVQQLPDSPVRRDVEKLLSTALGGAAPDEDQRTVNTPRDQLGVIRHL